MRNGKNRPPKELGDKVIQRRLAQILLSPQEAKLLKLVPPHGKIDTERLAKRFYGGDIPMHGRVIIVGLVRTLTIKRKLHRSERRGPHPIEVWRA